MWGPSDKTAFPSPEEILSAQKEIKALEIELRDAVEAVEKAQLCVENLTKRLEEGRAWIAPIRRLPVELLSEIFVLNSKDEPLGPVKIASVCRRWRSVILATPHTWCRIWLHNNRPYEKYCQYVRTFLERSDPLPLHLSFPRQYNFDDKEALSVWTILFENSHRIQCFGIHGSDLTYLRGRTFPHLTNLSLRYQDRLFSPSITFTPTFPRLEVLVAPLVTWGKLPGLMSSWFPPLKRLAIGADYEHVWLDILQYCSATLECLSVWCESYTPRKVMLSFPALKFLELTGYIDNIKWLTQVKTPALVSYRENKRSPEGRLHGDVSTVTHLQTVMVPALLEYRSLRILGLRLSLGAAFVLFKQLEENANICPQLEVIELVLADFFSEEGRYSAHAKIKEAHQKTTRDIRLIIGERWNIVMAFDMKLSKCKDAPCEFMHERKRLSIKQ